MAHFAFELEDGSGVIQLEDGSGNWLLEDQTGDHGGVILVSPSRLADPYLPSKQKSIEVEFTFRILANTITRIKIKLSAFTESIPKLDTEKLRDAFIIYSVYEKIAPLFKKVLKKSLKEAVGEEIINQLDANPLAFIRDLIRWKKKQH